MILNEEDLIQKNIQSEIFERKLKKLSKRYLKKISCNHMFFSIENRITKERLEFSTRPDWQKYYIGEKLIDNCPLYATTVMYPRRSNQESFFFLWNKVVPEGRKQRQVVELRKEAGIANGISLTKQIGIYQAMLGIGTDPKNNELERNYDIFMPTIISLLVEASDLRSEFKKPSENVIYLNEYALKA